MYSVSDAAKMLNVNEETVRRWIRDGKLQAKRAVGRGGNSLSLEDIVAFANQPPRAYLLSLEVWLAENHIAYEKIDDSVAAKDGNVAAAAAAGAAAAGAAGFAATSVATTSVVGASLATGAGIASAALGPIGLGIGAVAGVAYGASKLMKRKNYQKYSIKLVEVEPDSDNSEDGTKAIASACVPELEAVHADLTEMTESTVDSSSENSDPRDSMPTASPMNVLNEIACAKQLLDAGIITEEEFTDIKARLIAKI